MRIEFNFPSYWWCSSRGKVSHSGYRNIYEDLLEAGIDCGRDRVLRLMRTYELRALRGYNKPRGYYGGVRHEVVPNLLDRQFEVEAPNQWWVSDITYIRTHEGFLFLVVVMELFARNIVGWSMSNRITDDLVLDALTMAHWRRRPDDTVRLHSDQGSQYSSRACKKMLEALDIEPSMSRRGNCHDNAIAESFFANLKKEKIRRKKYRTREDARQAVFEYIELFYNPKGRHTHNDRVSPMIYEQRYLMKNGSV